MLPIPSSKWCTLYNDEKCPRKAERIADDYNAAFQSATGEKKKVAEAKGTMLILKSLLIGGSDGRIFVSSDKNQDVADIIFDYACKNKDDCIIPVEAHRVAPLDGTQDFAPTNTLTCDLAKLKYGFCKKGIIAQEASANSSNGSTTLCSFWSIWNSYTELRGVQ